MTRPEPLEDLLDRSAQDDAPRVYVEGGWVERTTTVPVEAGVAAVVRFARTCWERNLGLQMMIFTADRKLAQAEAALRELTDQIPLTKEVAIALAAVHAAREAMAA